MPLPADATVADLQRLVTSKHIMRVLVFDRARNVRVVHVRDTLLASPPDTKALEFSRPPAVIVTPTATVQRTLDLMRARGEQLVMVGRPSSDNAAWILTWDDIMGQLWPQITEQLDQAAPPAAS